MAVYNPFSLENKTVLITGASSGIGRASAIECSKMGATVYITGRDCERLQQTMGMLEINGHSHKAIAADLSTNEGIEKLVSESPKLDGVLLCAGIPNTLPMQFSDTEKFSDVFNINFFSPVELLRLLYKKKILQKSSSVVFIASVAGIRRTLPGNGIYGTSKSALNAAMKYFALEFAVARQIRVNSICPGMTETPLIHAGSITEEQMMEDRNKNPLKRYAMPSDIAMAAIYLLSDASSYVNGVELVVDGGATI